MYNERLQILVSREQRRTLESEAARRRTSVAAVVREAIDARLDTVDHVRRRAAFAELVHLAEAYSGPTYTVDELGELLDRSHSEEIGRGFSE